MDSFFTRSELDKFTKTSTVEKDPNCLTCGLYKKCKHPKMKHTGEGKLNCLIVAEGPASEEDSTGIQLKGKVGQYFRNKLQQRGLDLDRDFWKINAINCWPRDNKGNTRPPTKAEVEYCRPMVENTIKELSPKFIWLMGSASIQSFYMGQFSNLKPTLWRGLCIPDQKTNAFILPLFHPSYAQRGEHIDQNLVSQYDRDLDNAIKRSTMMLQRFSFADTAVECIYTFDAVITLLDKILKELPKYLFFDWETTGLKPYRPGHKIVSMSLAFSPDKAYSFPLQYRNHWTANEYIQIKKRIRAILHHPKIEKQAHNLKFEHIWAKQILGVETTSWDWCSMNAAHILDNRNAFTNLTFQTYINFGILPYDKRMDKYKRAEGKEFNKIEEAPLDELLEYGGRDSLYGSNLVIKQKKEFEQRGGKLLEAYRFFHRGLIDFSQLEQVGIPIDEDNYEESEKVLTTKIATTTEKLLTCKEAKKFEEITHRRINLASSKDIGQLVYDILGANKIKTQKDNYSTDEDALQASNLPFTNDLLKLRRLDKLLNTYFAQFKRYVINGKLHPSFDLHIPISFRSASSTPNFQNIPIREAEAKKYCRSGIVPSPGNILLESDFKGIEVSTGTCYHKDPTMIKYNTDPTTDMHRDTAMDLWKLPADEVTSDIRFFAKNDWVFAQFYGSWFKECGKSLWKDCETLKTKSGKPLREHARSFGVKTFNDFLEHCKHVEQLFWQVRFKRYKQWKDENNALYRKQGFLETYFGFIFSGPMSFNEVCNYQIQGTAFHLLLWTLIEVMKVKIEEKWKSEIIAQIHDSMLIDTVPEEKDYIIKTIDYIGTVKIREVFPWIIVPLSIDYKTTPIDGSWYELGKQTTVRRPSRRR